MLLKSVMNVFDVHSENNSDVGFPFPKQDSHRKKKKKKSNEDKKNEEMSSFISRR